MFSLECAGGTNQNEDANYLLKLLWRACGRLNRSAGRASLVIRARISRFGSSNLTDLIETLTIKIPTSVVFCWELTSALTLAIAGTLTRFGASGVTRPAESVFPGRKSRPPPGSNCTRHLRTRCFGVRWRLERRRSSSPNLTSSHNSRMAYASKTPSRPNRSERVSGRRFPISSAFRCGGRIGGSAAVLLRNRWSRS